MKKKLVEPFIRIPFITSNGVTLLIESFPEPEMSSNRWDAKIIGYDFNNIRTNIFLKDVARLIKDISELEDPEEDIRNDALSHFDEDVSKLKLALGCNGDDLQKLKAEVFNSRAQVLHFKSV